MLIVAFRMQNHALLLVLYSHNRFTTVRLLLVPNLALLNDQWKVAFLAESPDELSWLEFGRRHQRVATMDVALHPGFVFLTHSYFHCGKVEWYSDMAEVYTNRWGCRLPLSREPLPPTGPGTPAARCAAAHSAHGWRWWRAVGCCPEWTRQRPSQCPGYRLWQHPSQGKRRCCEAAWTSQQDRNAGLDVTDKNSHHDIWNLCDTYWDIYKK